MSKQKAGLGSKKAKRTKLQETPFGKVFVRSDLKVVGRGSLHLEANEPGRCYVDCSKCPPEEMKFDDGSWKPTKVILEEIHYDPKSRTLKYVTNWAPKTFQGA